MSQPGVSGLDTVVKPEETSELKTPPTPPPPHIESPRAKELYSDVAGPPRIRALPQALALTPGSPNIGRILRREHGGGSNVYDDKGMEEIRRNMTDRENLMAQNEILREAAMDRDGAIEWYKGELEKVRAERDSALEELKTISEIAGKRFLFLLNEH